MSSIKDLEKINTPKFWNDIYKKNEAGWDTGSTTPAFVNYFKSIKTSKKIIVPGAGNGYDCIYLSSLNHSVYAVDFAEKAIDNMNSNNVSNLNVIFEDYFNLDSKYNNTFDYFLEYTFYCAINPSRRYEYIKKAYNLLKPNGIFVGFLLPVNKPLDSDGPPFGVPLKQTEKIFSDFFKDIKISKSKYSIKARIDNELFITMKKKCLK